MQMVAHTDGSSLWSDEARKVQITGLRVVVDIDEEDEEMFGELLIFFDTQDWNTREHGLIYTDKQFLQDVQNELAERGFSEEAVQDIDYSEQGMQDAHYVSCDVGAAFINEARNSPDVEVV